MEFLRYFRRSKSNPMKKAVLLSVLSFYFLFLKATTYYSSNGTAPNVTTSWHVNTNGTGATPANFTSGDIFVIQTGHLLTTTANWSISGTNGKLLIQTGATLLANDRVMSPSFQIDGTGTYIHNGSTNTVPGSTTRTLAATSTVEIRNWNGGAALPSPTTWGNLIINTVGFTNNQNQGGTLTDIAGTLTIRNTGAGTNEFRLSASESYTLTIGGDLIIEGGVLQAGQANGNFNQKIIINGSYNQSGGSFIRTNNTGALQVEFNGANGTFTKTAGTITNTYVNWVVNATKKLTLNSGFAIALSRTITVNGTLDCNTRQVTGTGSFTLSSTGTLSTANTSGVDGSIQVTGAASFVSGASYEFHAATTSPFPGVLSTVTATNVVVDANVTLNKNVSVTGSLSLVTGKLIIPTARILTVASESTITGSGFGVSKHIVTQVNTSTGATGTLRVSSLTGTATFPIGNGTYYLPITLTTASAFDFSISVFQGVTNNGTANGVPFNSVQKSIIVDAEWIVNKNSGTGAVTMTLSWPAALEGSSFSAFPNSSVGIAHYGTYWESPLGSGNQALKTVTRTGITTFSPFGIGKVGTPLPLKFGDLKVYKENTDLTLDWSTYDELNVDHFEIERSQNGEQFVTLGMITARGNGYNSKSDYRWIDPSPYNNTSFYCVKEIDIDGGSKYSSIVRVDMSQDNSALNLFPNPVVDKKLSLAANIERGKYRLLVTNLEGKKIYDQALDHTGGIVSQSIQLPSTITAGIYLLTINGSPLKMTRQFIVR